MNLNITSTTPNAVLSEIRDGWENDEWGSLEEEPAEEMEELNHHQNTSRSNSNSSSAANNNTENNISPIKNNIHDMKINTNSNSSNWEVTTSTNWNDDEFEPIDEPGAGLHNI